jgi:hypothetical protein
MTNAASNPVRTAAARSGARWPLAEPACPDRTPNPVRRGSGFGRALPFVTSDMKSAVYV